MTDAAPLTELQESIERLIAATVAARARTRSAEARRGHRGQVTAAAGMPGRVRMRPEERRALKAALIGRQTLAKQVADALGVDAIKVVQVDAPQEYILLGVTQDGARPLVKVSWALDPWDLRAPRHAEQWEWACDLNELIDEGVMK